MSSRLFYNYSPIYLHPPNYGEVPRSRNVYDPNYNNIDTDCQRIYVEVDEVFPVPVFGDLAIADYAHHPRDEREMRGFIKKVVCYRPALRRYYVDFFAWGEGIRQN